MINLLVKYELSLAFVLFSSGCTVLFGSPRSDAPADAAAADLAVGDGAERATWTPQTSKVTSALYGVWGCSANDVLVVGAGAILRSTTPGTWTNETPMNFTGTLFSVGSYDCAHVWTVGTGGDIYFSQASGSWMNQFSFGNVELRGVWATAAGTAVVGNTGELEELASMMGVPPMWMRLPRVNNSTLTAVFGQSAIYVAVGAAGTILRSTDSGATWAAVQSPTAGTLRAGCFTAGGDAFVVGDGGALLHSNDGGSKWDLLPAPTSADLRGVWGDTPQDLFVVGSGATILHSTDGAGSWVPENGMTGVNLNGVWGTGPGDVYAVGDDGTILHRP